MKGEIILTDYILEHIFEYEIEPTYLDFALSIYVSKDKTLESQLKNKKGYEYCVDYMLEYGREMKERNKGLEKQASKISRNFDKLFDKVEFVKLRFTQINPKEYIINNPMILSKKIILDEQLTITDYDKIICLMEEYKDVIGNIYVELEGNQKYVKLTDAYETIMKIKVEVDKIKSLDLSPMEEVMYAYDQVRNRVYDEESASDDYYKSRDLTEVILGDKIVCVGFANMFQAYLYYLGINNRLVDLRRYDEPGHIRNAAYINDPKYNIDGVYYFDATWDSKKKDETNEYLNRYRFFARTKDYMYDLDHYINVGFDMYSKYLYKEVKNIISSGAYEKLMPYAKTINNMSKLAIDERLINIMCLSKNSPMYGEFDKNELLEKLALTISKFNKEIPAETMVILLNNVRKIEYYEDPALFPYTIRDMYKTAVNSKWKFDNRHLSDEEKLLNVIFGKIEERKISYEENYINFLYENEVTRDINSVKLTKVLSFVRDSKKK